MTVRLLVHVHIKGLEAHGYVQVGRRRRRGGLAVACRLACRRRRRGGLVVACWWGVAAAAAVKVSTLPATICKRGITIFDNVSSMQDDSDTKHVSSLSSYNPV